MSLKLCATLIQNIEDHTQICYRLYEISLKMNTSLQIRSSSCAVSQKKEEGLSSINK